MPNKAQAIYPGMIIGYNADNTPSTFAECNGADGTFDLRDKFLMAAGSTYAYGTAGGATTHNHTVEGYPGGGSLANYSGYPSTIAIQTPGTFSPGGTCSPTSLVCNSASNLPPFYALPFLQAKSVGAIPVDGIVWWPYSVASIPAGWTVFSALYDKFIVGARGTYARGLAGGALNHGHTGTSAGTFQISTAPGGPIKPGGYSKNGTLTGNLALNNASANILPLYYGFVPIIATGTRGIYTGMVLPFKGDLAALIATGTWQEFNGSKNRLPIGAGSTYAVNSTGGGSIHGHSSGTWGGSGNLSAGTDLGLGGSPLAWMPLFTGSGSAMSIGLVGQGLPPWLALYFVQAL